MSVRFVSVARVIDVPEGRGRRFVVEGRPIALFRIDGAIRAVDDTCPHRGASLGEEAHVDGDGRIVCGWHGWTFDPATGIRQPTGETCLACYEVRVEGGEVLIAIEPPD